MNDEVHQAIVEVLGRMNYDVAGVTADTVLGAAGLDLESLAVAELALWAEDEYGSKFAEAEMEKFGAMTIAMLADEITRRARPTVAVRQGE
jgi:acyl carrier protein